MARHRNDGLRKICGCARPGWPKCRHSWYFNFKPHNGTPHRFSLDGYVRKAGLTKRFGAHVATKADAEELVDEIRVAIREGRFRLDAPAAPVADLTVRQLGTFYAEKFLALHRPRIVTDETYRLGLIAETTIQRPDGSLRLFGDLAAADVKAGDVDAFVETRLKGGKRKHCRCTKDEWSKCKHAWHKGSAGGRVSVNRCLARLRAVFNWGIKKGYVESTPFKVHGVTAVSLLSEQERYRRLEQGEESRLLAAASPHLQALVIAALETACRQGELLSLQWGQVRMDTRKLHLPASKTKAGRDRILPMSDRLHAVIEMRRLDADGEEHPDTAYVFGNEVGEQVGSIKTAWRATCRRAGIADLHFHDLRREAGSRLLESGHFGLHAVRQFLDHANISTTSRYLRAQQHDLDKAMRAYDTERKAVAKKAAKAGKGKAHGHPSQAARGSASTQSGRVN